MAYESKFGKGTWKSSKDYYKSHLDTQGEFTLQARFDKMQKAAVMPIWEKLIKTDDTGAWVQKVYEAWPITEAPKKVITADRTEVLTWPLPWAEVKALLEVMLVDNTTLPHITAECVTWPAVQRILRQIW